MQCAEDSIDVCGIGTRQVVKREVPGLATILA